MLEPPNDQSPTRGVRMEGMGEWAGLEGKAFSLGKAYVEGTGTQVAVNYYSNTWPI